MEPDPIPESSNLNTIHTEKTKITNSDIKQILGVSKKEPKNQMLYLFSKRVIIAVSTVTTLIYFSFHYFGIV